MILFLVVLDAQQKHIFTSSISNISTGSFLLCSISVLWLPMWFCMVPTLSIKAINVLVIVILNSLLDSSNIYVISDSCSDVSFVSWEFFPWLCISFTTENWTMAQDRADCMHLSFCWVCVCSPWLSFRPSWRSVVLQFYSVGYSSQMPGVILSASGGSWLARELFFQYLPIFSFLPSLCRTWEMVSLLQATWLSQLVHHTPGLTCSSPRVWPTFSLGPAGCPVTPALRWVHKISCASVLLAFFLLGSGMVLFPAVPEQKPQCSQLGSISPHSAVCHLCKWSFPSSLSSPVASRAASTGMCGWWRALYLFVAPYPSILTFTISLLIPF